MDTGTNPKYREGLARVLLAVCLLLFATSLGVLFLDVAALGPPGLFGALIFFVGFAFSLIGFGLAMNGFSLMTRRHA